MQQTREKYIYFAELIVDYSKSTMIVDHKWAIYQR